MKPSATSYQLHIHLAKTVQIRVGALGSYLFPAGRYIYTGSAKRNMTARIQRHQSKEKTLRWHIDYLLNHSAATVEKVETSNLPECQWNQSTPGTITVARFGASDCKAGCGAHLKYLGDTDLNKP